MDFLDEIKQVERDAQLLYSADQVESALDRMAGEITARLGETNPIVLTVLNGGIIFAGQLITRLQFPLQIDSVNASRYRGETSGGEIHWRLKPALSLKNRTVLLADDILDEGITLAALIDWCHEQGASAVYSTVLIDKQIGRERPCRADFIGLETQNHYLFGYGMDYKNYLRNANGIFACKGL
jgi:hypoxanthine phosphoribosyltransferase